MYDLDHLLYGKISNYRHQEIIRQVQREHLAQNVKAAQGNPKTLSPIHAALIAVINLLTK